MKPQLPDLSVLSFAHTVAPIGTRKRGLESENNLDSEEEKKERARLRARLAPCHDELKFEQGEAVNVDSDRRVCGASAKFTSLPLSADIPYGVALTTREQLDNMYGATTVGTDRVLKELYSKRETSETDLMRKEEEDHAYMQTWGNGRRPQYDLMTVGQKTTLTHTLTGSSIWDSRMYVRREHIVDPKVDDTCFTNGVIWTNPAPGWAYKSDPNEGYIRVRIDIPPGTQVIIDRAPVYGGVPCRYDDDHTSVFPDVLLAPAKFVVTSVVHYRSNAEDYNATTEKPARSYTYVTPARNGSSTSDNDYAARRVFDSNGELMDVRMTLVQQVELPPVDSVSY